MRVAGQWEELQSKSATVADLTFRGALQLLAAPRPPLPEGPGEGHLPGVLAYLDMGALSEHHAEALAALRGIYGPDLLRTLDPGWYKDLEVSEEDAESLVNQLRPEEIPPLWHCRCPFSSPCPAAVVAAGQAFQRQAQDRRGVLPQWEVAAFWWASQVALVPLDVPALALAIDRWRERFESCLAWWDLHEGDESEDPALYHAVQGDLGHSGAVDLPRAVWERTKAGDEAASEKRMHWFAPLVRGMGFALPSVYQARGQSLLPRRCVS
jgi:hypothetical protein